MATDKRHFINGSLGGKWSACGLGWKNTTTSPGEVTCLQCRRTLAWRNATAVA